MDEPAQEVSMFVRGFAAAVLLLAVSTDPQSDDAFVKWTRGRMVRIDPAGRAFRTLDHAIAGARLIGVGESIHETQPFGTFRRQLLEDLVRRHRVTALILESGLPDAMALDDYVRGRTPTVDFNTAIPGDLGTLVHIREATEWLREWNLGPGRRRPVGVYGADLPGRQGSMVPALDRLADLSAGDAAIRATIDSIRPTAVQTSSTWWRGAAQKYDALTPDAKSALASDVGTLVERVHHLTMSDKERLEWAQRVARVAQQHESTLRIGMFAPTAPRDEAMAENILWILDRLPAGERAVYWAHNAHVQRVPVTGSKLPPGAFPSAGTRLGAALGRRYLAIGTAYGGPSREDQTPPSPGSVDAALEKVGTGPFLLSLRGGERSPEVDSWLAQERAMRFQVGYLTLPAGSAFDVLAYFDRATPAPRATTSR
jgi:erythromycin esterase